MIGDPMDARLLVVSWVLAGLTVLVCAWRVWRLWMMR